MADLGQTNAAWLRFMKEASFFYRLTRTAEESRRRYYKERIQLVNMNDATSATPHFTALTLAGVTLAEDTDAAGLIYVRFVANSSNWDVHLYKASGGSGGNEVARSINVAASATGAITAVNSSGVTGSLTLGAAIAGETNDRHRIHVLTDWKRELLTLWPSDGTTENDTASRSAATRLLTRLAELEVDKIAAIQAAYEEWAISAADNEDARGNEWLSEALTSLQTEVRKADTSGAVSRPRMGHFPSLSAAMEEETTGSEQDIVKRLTAGGAGVFSSNNDGSGAVASHTPDQRAPAGRVTFKCVTGLGNDGGGIEEFDWVFKEDALDRVISGRGLRIKQSYKLKEGMGPVVLTRTRTKTGDGSNANVGVATTFSETGERESNTDGGVIYGRIDANASNWDVSWYKSTNRAVGDLVAKATNVATAAVGVQAVAQNGSGLTVTFTVGSGPVDTTANFSVDMNFFNVENSSGVPDEFYLDVSETSSGVLARILAEVWRTELNGDTSGSEQLDEDVMGTISTFVPRITIDI